MIKVIFDLTGRESKEYDYDVAITYNILHLQPKLHPEHLTPVVDWCNKNLEKNVYMGILNWKISTAGRFMEVMEHNYAFPILIFSEESDMMAFKIRWTEYIFDG